MSDIVSQLPVKITDGTNTVAVEPGSQLRVDGSGVVQPVSGTVTKIPFGTQPVSGTVAVSNFPATQPVSGTITIANYGAPHLARGVSDLILTSPNGSRWKLSVSDEGVLGVKSI